MDRRRRRRRRRGPAPSPRTGGRTRPARRSESGSQSRHSRRDDRLDPAAGGECFVEDAKPRGLPDAQAPPPRSISSIPNRSVRLVRAEALDRVVVVEARERHLLDRPVGHDGAADFHDHGLHEVHDPLLVHEAHLEVQLGELRLAVAAQILVAEAAGDLEVAVDARDHEQLLELLGALRQRVDAARLKAAGDDEVARAFGRGLDQDRRLDFDEAGSMVRVADGPHQLRAEQQPVAASAGGGCRGSGIAAGPLRRPAHPVR